MDKKKGSALLSALFLMTLVAIAATAMSSRLQLDIYRNRITTQSDDLYLASQAVQYWSMNTLSEANLLLRGLDAQGRVLNYPSALEGIYPDIRVQGVVYDLQSRFNLNNLVRVNDKLSFLCLLQETTQAVPKSVLSNIVEATASWVSAFQPERGQDELTTYYLKQKPPYLPGYQPMQSISEWRLVAGVSPAIYRATYPYLTALPVPTPINLNTASEVVIQCLGNGLNPSQVAEIIALRTSKKTLEMRDFSLLIDKMNINPQQISVDSQYFLSIATVTSVDLKLQRYTVIQRVKGQDGKYTTHILAETLNSL